MKQNFKYRLGFVVIILFLSCQKDPKTMLPHINGYWEIEKVIAANGEEKNFTVNMWIDYIEIKENNGFRKKVRPTLEGKYIPAEAEEMIEIKIENDSLNMYYTTPFDTWKESILFADENKLIVINAEKFRYHYKRYQPLDLN